MRFTFLTDKMGEPITIHWTQAEINRFINTLDHLISLGDVDWVRITVE